MRIGDFIFAEQSYSHQPRFAGAILLLMRAIFMQGVKGTSLIVSWGLPRGVEGGTGVDEQVGLTISISKRCAGSGVVHGKTLERRRQKRDQSVGGKV